MVFPDLTTRRLLLNTITPSDVNAVFSLFSDPQVVNYYDLDEFTEISQAEKLVQLFTSRFQAATGIRWAIRLQDTGSLIGTCGFNSWSEKMRNAVIGYDLLPAYWNKGITTEAVSAIARGGFSGLLPCGALHRIQADTIPGNVASERVLLKLGFKEEGLRREAILLKGTYRDMKCFGLLRHEFKDI